MDQPTPDPTPAPADPFEADPVVAGLVNALTRAGGTVAARPVPQLVADRHLAAIHAAATEHAHGAAVVVSGTAGLGARVRRVLGLTGVKVALAAGVAAAATGGLAAGGNLPPPAQRVISEGASWFGVHLPSPGQTPEPTSVLPDEANSEAEERVTTRSRGPELPDPAPSSMPTDREVPEPGPVESPEDRPTDRPSDPGPPSEPPSPAPDGVPSSSPSDGGSPSERPAGGGAPSAPPRPAPEIDEAATVAADHVDAGHAGPVE